MGEQLHTIFNTFNSLAMSLCWLTLFPTLHQIPPYFLSCVVCPQPTQSGCPLLNYDTHSQNEKRMCTVTNTPQLAPPTPCSHSATQNGRRTQLCLHQRRTMSSATPLCDTWDMPTKVRCGIGMLALGHPVAVMNVAENERVTGKRAVQE